MKAMYQKSGGFMKCYASFVKFYVEQKGWSKSKAHDHWEKRRNDKSWRRGTDAEDAQEITLYVPKEEEFDVVKGFEQEQEVELLEKEICDPTADNIADYISGLKENMPGAEIDYELMNDANPIMAGTGVGNIMQGPRSMERGGDFDIETYVANSGVVGQAEASATDIDDKGREKEPESDKAASTDSGKDTKAKRGKGKDAPKDDGDDDEDADAKPPALDEGEVSLAQHNALLTLKFAENVVDDGVKDGVPDSQSFKDLLVGLRLRIQAMKVTLRDTDEGLVTLQKDVVDKKCGSPSPDFQMVSTLEKLKGEFSIIGHDSTTPEDLAKCVKKVAKLKEPIKSLTVSCKAQADRVVSALKAAVTQKKTLEKAKLKSPTPQTSPGVAKQKKPLAGENDIWGLDLTRHGHKPIPVIDMKAAEYPKLLKEEKFDTPFIVSNSQTMADIPKDSKFRLHLIVFKAGIHSDETFKNKKRTTALVKLDPNIVPCWRNATT